MPSLPFDTNQPSQIKPLEGYRVDPLFTVGETIGDYTPIGILDGTGAYSLNDTTMRVLVNHEVGSDVGYQYTLASGAELTGARISYFDIDKRTLKIIDSGLAFDTIYNRAGEEVTPTTPLDTIEGEFGLDRFCSANLMEAYQFGNGRGFADTIYFAGEETDNGTEFALNVETNELWALPWLGVAAWESVTELDTGTTDKVALLIGDDRGPAPLYLYVGTKGVDYDENGQINFLERNGLTGGNLYAWVADDPSNNADVIEADARDFSGTGNSTKGRFVEVDIYDETGALPGYDDLGFATQDTQDALAADVNAFLMSRPEDLATNPNKGNQAVVASTGRTGILDDADVWGTTYIVDVNFTDLANGNIGGDIKILYDGNDFETNGVSHPDYGLRSPDNLDWADDGKIYLQEDRAISSDLFGATSGEEASIWSIDPTATAPETTLTRVAQIDRTAVPSGQTDSAPTDIGNWESSGILDVSTLLGNQPGTVLLFDVQAHSVRDGNIINVPGIDTDGDGTVEANDNLAQGGQLSLLIAPGANLVQPPITLSAIGTYATGQYDESAAEIPAYDPASKRLFVVNAQNGKVDVLDASNPTNPTLITSIDTSTFGFPNSVTIKDGLVAIAVENADKQANGQVVFYSANSQDFATPLKALEVGALPDMLTFSPDGKKVLVANEGEPSGDYTIDPEGSVSIIDLSLGINSATVQTANFTAFNNQFAQLKAAGVKFKGDVGTTRTVAQDLEPEYIAVSPDGTKAWVTLQEANAIAIIDIATATVESIKPLGFKNYSQTNNALDASDRDDAINIRNWPIFGMYQPDGIAPYTANNQTYYITANEGDAREYGDYVEAARIKDLTLDPTVFPDAADLKTDSKLGRLLVTTERGDTDGDGDYDQLYTFGGRSFSIWNNQGQLVYDSGDDFERITAEQFPEYFNASNSNNTFDNRSDDKGPEPEGLVTGKINDRTYAFVGLERIGGVMIYDVTDPVSPTFVQYINNRDFTATTDTAAAKDLGPEGLAFISAQDSPNGKPMLVVANEVSGSTTFYEIDLKETNPPPTNFTLQILHTSDQEAGIPALQDAIGLSAVMNALDPLYENTLKLSSGDMFIAGPFFNASTDLYGQAGIADILIQNELGWNAAAVGNHEFDGGPGTFYNLLAPKATTQGVGIDPTKGYAGSLFPYLATNLDYSTDSSNLKNLVVPNGEAPKPNTLAGSVVVTINGEKIGVVGAVVPYLPQIANIGGITMLTDASAATLEAQSQSLAGNIQPVVDALTSQGIDKIVLMTHLQQFELEQALAPKLKNVDVLMGGGSHRVMANSDDPLRADETQTPPQLLQPYPQIFKDAEGQDIYLINTGANYRYLGQLVLEFDAEGRIVKVGDDSGTFATDIAGVDRLYTEDITSFEQVKAKADTELVQVVDNVGTFINSLDSKIFGNTTVFLNGIRGSVRTEETNLGNLTADANLWYAEKFGFDIDISVKNGGGIRDQIGVSYIDGGTNELIQLPPQANPAVGKEEGDVSQLDIGNSLRFDNKLSVADVSAKGIKDLAEYFVANWLPGATPGQFGQIGGFAFSYDPDNTAIEFTRDANGLATGLKTEGQRIQNLVLIKNDGTKEVIFQDGQLQVPANQSYKMVILEFLATGGDGYPAFYFENVVKLSELAGANLPDQAPGLIKAGEQDALAEYLAQFHPDATKAYNQADTAIAQDTRIQNLNFRSDTVLPEVIPPNQDISDRVTQFNNKGDNLGSLNYNLNDAPGNVYVKADDAALKQTDALFHNLVGLYQVENANGAILDTLDLNGNGLTNDLLNPGDTGYARTAITNTVNNFVLQLGANGNPADNTNASEFGDVLLQGGKRYAPFAIANGGNLIPTGGTLQDGIDSFLTQNPNNTAANLSDFMTHAVAYFSFGMANPDGAEHLQNRGDNVFGFEDLPGNLGISDFDFNDSVFKFTFTS